MLRGIASIQDVEELPITLSSLGFFMLPLLGHETTCELRTLQQKGNP